MAGAVEHSKVVATLSRRMFALTLMLSLAAGNLAVCEGWAPTPEARMACCENETACPMHKSDSTEPQPHRAMSQAQADSCCAASEGDSSDRSNPSAAFTI